MLTAKLILLFILICESYGNVYECQTDQDCLGGSKCADNQCKCPGIDKVFNTFGTECLKLSQKIEDACEDNNQCSLLTGYYTCNKQKCSCGDGWVYFKGKCVERKKNDAACSIDEDCFNGIDYFARKCTEGLCKCNAGYYERGNYDCRPESKVDEPCFIDSDCAKIGKDAFCNMGKCAENQLEGPKIFNFVDTLDDDDDEPELVINESCNDNSGCTEAHTYCSPIFKECVCKLGYYNYNNKCYLEMGMPCSKNEECRSISTHKAVCKDEICACEDGLIIGGGNKKCVQQTYAPGYYCSSDATCKPLLTNYECQTNTLTKECQCKWGYKYDEFMACSVYACISNESCDQLLGNSICTKAGVCECEPGSTIEDESCYGGIGSKCRLIDDCKKVENSICHSTSLICLCSSNYIDDGNGQCLKLVNMDEDCTIDLQCKFSNGVCSKETNKCVCQNGFMRIDNACFKIAESMYDVCPNENICTEGLGPNVKCRNGFCQCESHMKPTEDQLDCENGSAKMTFNMSLLLTVLIYAMY